MTKSISWYILGGLSLIAGFFALFNPVAATFAAETLAGASFLAIGILQLFVAFREEGWKARIWAIVIAVAFIALGVSLLANPVAGIISLTILAAILLFVTGVSKIIMASAFRDRSAYWTILVSGLLSLALALLILFGMPSALAITLGIFFAMELISTGVALISIGHFLPRLNDMAVSQQ